LQELMVSIEILYVGRVGMDWLIHAHLPNLENFSTGNVSSFQMVLQLLLVSFYTTVVMLMGVG
jgi:hypothetical protein